jgi:hypothetical protein
MRVVRMSVAVDPCDLRSEIPVYRVLLPIHPLLDSYLPSICPAQEIAHLPSTNSTSTVAPVPKAYPNPARGLSQL